MERLNLDRLADTMDQVRLYSEAEDWAGLSNALANQEIDGDDFSYLIEFLNENSSLSL